MTNSLRKFLLLTSALIAALAVLSAHATPSRAAVTQPSFTSAVDARIEQKMSRAKVPSASVVSAAKGNSPEWLFVQNASQRGAMLVLKKNGTGTLVMNADNPGIVAFTDRPYRKAKLISMFAMAKTWTQGADSFAVDPPNAILTGTLWGATHSVGLELLSMKARKVGPTRWQTTFKVKMLHIAGDHTFDNKLPSVGAHIPVSHASLFIDGFWDWLEDAVSWVNDNVIQPIVKSAQELIQETINAVNWAVGQVQDIYAISKKFVEATVEQARNWVANLGAEAVFDMLWHVIAFVFGFIVPGPDLLKKLAFLFNNGTKISTTAGLGAEAGCYADFRATTFCGSYLTSLVDQIYDNMPRPMLDWMVGKQNVADGLIKLTNALHDVFGGLVCAMAPRAAVIDGVSKALAQVIVFGDGAASQQKARNYVSGSGFIAGSREACPLS